MGRGLRISAELDIGGALFPYIFLHGLMEWMDGWVVRSVGEQVACLQEHFPLCCYFIYRHETLDVLSKFTVHNVRHYSWPSSYYS